jgi:hypothetical protein
LAEAWATPELLNSCLSTPVLSILSAVAGWAHLHQLRVKPTKDTDQIGLGGHDGVDVLINTRYFIKAGGEKLNAQLSEQLPRRAQVKDCIAFARLMIRPAPCDAECSDWGKPLPRTT